MNHITEKTIDVREILKSKMGDKARYVPAPVVKWLERILHQDEVNEFLWDSRGLTGVEWLEATVRYLDMTLDIVGRENLPPKDDGRLYTFVSNHPLGGVDGVALGSIIGKHYDGRFRYLVNDLLMNLPGLAPLCVGINKTGHNGRNFPAMVKAAFEGDNHILMFPAGLCSRKINGQIHDIPWTKTFIVKSVAYQRDVVPIHFSGQNSERFYRIANLCKTLKLKFNVAMLFLVDEMYLNVHKTFKVSIGKPIPWQELAASTSVSRTAQQIREMVYALHTTQK